MGRCCREPVPKNGRIGNVYVYFPSHVKPYDREEVEAGELFIETLLADKKLLCQADLANRLAAMQIPDPFIEGGFTGFLDAGPYAMAQDESFREGDDFTVTASLIQTLKSICSNVQLANQRPMATLFRCRGVSPVKMQNWADIFAKHH